MVNLITLDARSFQFLFNGNTFLYDMNIGVTGYIDTGRDNQHFRWHDIHRHYP